MGISDLVEKYAQSPTKNKVAIIALVTVFFGAIFYFVLYSDLADQADRTAREIKDLTAQKADYEDKKQKYMAFRAEVNKLLEEQKELLKVLPTDAKISTFLQSIHAQAELAGLNILSYEQHTEVRKEFYAEIPVTLAVSGQYHKVTKFFHAMEKDLKRIVNIQDLKLGEGTLTEQGVVLKANFKAFTYRFLGEEAPPPAPPGAAPPPPGQNNLQKIIPPAPPPAGSAG